MDPLAGGPATRRSILNGDHSESQGQFSPDGRHVAYRSNETGRWEIYVRPYPGPGSQQPVSNGGGIQPRWRNDGKELFYVDQAGRLMAQPVRLDENGDFHTSGPPISLFSARLAFPHNQQFGYAVEGRGQQFLMSTGDRISTAPITVVQNWAASLPR